MLCEKIYIVDKALQYVIKFVAWIVTALSFLYFCFIPAPIFHTLYNVIIVISTHLSEAINFTTSYTLDTIPYNASIMENNFRKICRFKTVVI